MSKIEKPAFSVDAGIEFDPLQLDLPFPLATCTFREDAWHGEREWPAPQVVLTEYLAQVGVSDPSQAARALLAEFGTLSKLLSASWWRLCRTVGYRAASILSASRDLTRTALLERVANGPVLSNSAEVVELLRTYLGPLTHERLIALHVDHALRLIRIQTVSEGSRTGAPIDVRSIIQTAFDVGAAGVLLVHNHPSGNPKPSATDVLVTHRLKRLFTEFDLHLVDHLIVADAEVQSCISDAEAE